MALLLGVTIRTEQEVVDVKPPNNENTTDNKLWNVSIRDMKKNETLLEPANVLLAAGGANDASTKTLGFESVVMATRFGH